MAYNANEARYSDMRYEKCGDSGLKLPAVSLGLWHNFGDNSRYIYNQIDCSFLGILDNYLSISKE